MSSRPDVSIVVPLGGAEPHRARAWEWLRARYATELPDWEIVEARADEDPWRKGVAMTRGASAARGETLVAADADCLVSSGALRDAVRLIALGAPWVVPHRHVRRLDQPSTDRLIATGELDRAALIRQPYVGFAGGGVFVISRRSWVLSGGIPHSFYGWGSEDEALGIILDTLCGPHVRLENDLWHLWHPPGPRDQGRAYPRNEALLRRYRSAAGDRERMLALLSGADAAGDGVLMRATQDFWRGGERLRRGETFTADREEARRHRMRRVQLAVPVVALVDQHRGDAFVREGETFELRGEELIRESKRSVPMVRPAPPERRTLREIVRGSAPEPEPRNISELKLARAGHRARERGLP